MHYNESLEEEELNPFDSSIQALFHWKGRENSRAKFNEQIPYFQESLPKDELWRQEKRERSPKSKGIQSQRADRFSSFQNWIEELIEGVRQKSLFPQK